MMENPYKNNNLDHLELGYRAMMIQTLSSGPSSQVLMPISGKTSSSYLKPSSPPPQKRSVSNQSNKKPEAHSGGVNIQKYTRWLRWRFIVITLSVFLIEVILGSWTVIALSIWGWTSIYAIGHLLWWIKAGLLLPAVIRNMGTSYDLASESVKYGGKISTTGEGLYKVFWNSAYTWDLTLWSMTSVLGHTTISIILIILTIFTRHVIPSTLQWILLLVFDVVAIIESITSPWFVMDRAINRPTQEAREEVLQKGGRWDSDDEDDDGDDYYDNISRPPKIINAAFIKNPWLNAKKLKNHAAPSSRSKVSSLLSSAHIQGKIYRKPQKKKKKKSRHH